MSKTIEEIAAELSISVTTVRLVLLGKARQYRISHQTEARVRQFTEQHGYHINHVARSLRLQRTDSLALIIPRLSNHFFAALAEKLEIRCRQAGLQLFVSCCYDDPETQFQLIQNFRQRNIDGLFVVPSNAQIPPKAAQLFDRRVVLLDRDFGFIDYPVIITDNEISSYTMTRKLLAFAAGKASAGKLLFLVGNPDMPSIAARTKGFNQALLDAGFSASETRVYTAPRNGFAEGIEAMTQALTDTHALPSILISSSIPIFEGALHALRKLHGPLPDDLVLATFDDHTMLDFLPNPLCSARQDSSHMVSAAFAEMEKLLAGIHAPLRHVATMELIARHMPGNPDN